MWVDRRVLNAGQLKIVKTQGTVNKFATICFSMMDKDESLWFSTFAGEGAYRYDGKLFPKLYGKDGLCNNIVYTICQDKTGNLWFGTNTGVCCYDGEKFTDFSAKIGLSKNATVLCILEDKNGILWFGTTSGNLPL